MSSPGNLHHHRATPPPDDTMVVDSPETVPAYSPLSGSPLSSPPTSPELKPKPDPPSKPKRHRYRDRDLVIRQGSVTLSTKITLDGLDFIDETTGPAVSITFERNRSGTIKSVIYNDEGDKDKDEGKFGLLDDDELEKIKEQLPQLRGGIKHAQRGYLNDSDIVKLQWFLASMQGALQRHADAKQAQEGGMEVELEDLFDVLSLKDDGEASKKIEDLFEGLKIC